ncbi:hypothetical protein GOP47_0005869 [Adiantum capillus-veneris]|uniref:Uncharacterized protein n=1 Tax=Adiantum capillus-veneris TaxID=13818 RepID=A0A9D4V6J9_ADICA|nr:hypothetical protein GOP47_0005869 [Adiantum capillus-veneris]
MAGAGRGHSLGASPLEMVGRGSIQSGSPLSLGRGGSSGFPLSPKRGASSPSSGQESPQKRCKIPPSTATMEDFQLCNPFIEIVVKDPRKENPMDKFSGGHMDVKAVKAFF